MNGSAPAVRTLRPRNCVACGLGDLYGGGAFLLVSTLAMYYLVAVVGMSPIFASVALIWVPVRASTDLGLFAYYFLAYVFFYTVSTMVLVPYQLLPFVVDVDGLITGRKRAGTYAGAMTLIRKLVQGALVLPLPGLILAAIG